MSRTHEEICTLLAEKFKRESQRLNSWGTKTDDKASLSFAMAVSRYVESLMADSRYRELKRIDKLLDTLGSDDQEKVTSYIQERMKATKAMSAAIRNVAVTDEGKRAWGRKKKHKHGSHRGSRRSKD